jgi:hypothetical protein
LAAAPVLAQSSSAVLSGTVRDEQDRFITSAKVTLLDPARGQTRRASTDANGAFVFSQLAPSSYELAVEQQGFARALFSGVVINAGARGPLGGDGRRPSFHREPAVERAQLSNADQP